MKLAVLGAHHEMHCELLNNVNYLLSSMPFSTVLTERPVYISDKALHCMSEPSSKAMQMEEVTIRLWPTAKA